MTTATHYTADDAGCYVDGARGVYTVDRIVEIANGHGAEIQHDGDCGGDDMPSQYPGEISACEFANEYEDEATDYMNEHFPVDGHYWGRNENGDWGLWSEEDAS